MAALLALGRTGASARGSTTGPFALLVAKERKSPPGYLTDISYSCHFSVYGAPPLKEQTLGRVVGLDPTRNSLSYTEGRIHRCFRDAPRGIPHLQREATFATIARYALSAMVNEKVLRSAESESPSPRNVMVQGAPLALGTCLNEVPSNREKSIHNSSHSDIASRAVHTATIHLP